MISKKLSVLLLVLVAFLLTGCDVQVVADVYLQDLHEVAENPDAELSTTATLIVETLGGSYYDEVKELLENTFSETRNFRTVERNFSEHLAVDVKIPIYETEQLERLWLNDELFAVVVFRNEESEETYFGVVINVDKHQELTDFIYEEHWQSLSPKDYSITFKVINDFREPMTITVLGVYANQVPAFFEEDFVIGRREYLEVKFSDVLRDYAFQEEVVFFGSF